ncbi:MAG: glycosyltransferase family A protein [Nanoarchaeota archaeon]
MDFCLLTVSIGPPEIVDTLLLSYSNNIKNPYALVIDNGDPYWDGNKLKEILSKFSWASIIRMPSNIGHGQALDLGIRQIKNYYDYVIICDSDVVFVEHLHNNFNDIFKVFEDKKVIMASCWQDYKDKYGLIHEKEFPGIKPIERPDPSFAVLHIKRYIECEMPSFTPILDKEHRDVGARMAEICIERGFRFHTLYNIPVIHFGHLSVLSLCEINKIDSSKIPYIDEALASKRRFIAFRKYLLKE